MIGSNDVLNSVKKPVAERKAIISDTVGAIKVQLKKLYERGAWKFLVVNVSDIGLTPLYRGSSLEQTARQNAQRFNCGLTQAITEVHDLYGKDSMLDIKEFNL